jgi:hypothetical protein
VNDHERTFRGNLKCSDCFKEQDGKGYIMECSSLYQMEDGSYKSLCRKHKPEDNTPRVLTTTCTRIPWRDVVKITLHKLDEGRRDRRGWICTIKMRDVLCRTLMEYYAVEVAQALMLLAHIDCTIRDWGVEGEQHHCWITRAYPYEDMAPGHARVNHKYWSDEEVGQFRAACRFKAELHGWELDDETMPLLDRIADALDKKEE